MHNRKAIKNKIKRTQREHNTEEGIKPTKKGFKTILV